MGSGKNPCLKLVEKIRDFLETLGGIVNICVEKDYYKIRCVFKEAKDITIDTIHGVGLDFRITDKNIMLYFDQIPNVKVLAKAYQLGDIINETYFDITNQAITMCMFKGFYDKVIITVYKGFEGIVKEVIICLGDIE